MGLKEFIEWNKKVFSDTTHIIGFQYNDDGHGNKDFKFQAFGSKVMATERQESKEFIENEVDLIPQKQRKLLK